MLTRVHTSCSSCRSVTVLVVFMITMLGISMLSFSSLSTRSSPDIIERSGNILSRESSDIYGCVSQSDLLHRGVLKNTSSFRSNLTSRINIRRMASNRLTDDYCYCRRIIPPYSTPKPLNCTRNPCWWDEGGVLQCLPYFYIIGFSKCATTDMYRNLAQHPSILQMAMKEPHWFDYLRFIGDEWYRRQTYTQLFKSLNSKIETDVKQTGQSQLIFGDGTPCTVWFSLYWRCLHGNQRRKYEPLYTNADSLRQLAPNAKLIVMTRDPTQRLYSRYLFEQRTQSNLSRIYNWAKQRPSSLTFHEMCVRAVRLYTQCFKTRSHRSCAYDGNLYSQVILRLQEGMYSVFLKDWLQLFPKHQILLVNFDEYTRSKVESVSTVWSFLGLEPAPEKTVKNVANKAPVNKQKTYNSIGPMLEKTRKLLDDFYRPFQEELQAMIQNGAFTLIKDIKSSS